MTGDQEADAPAQTGAGTPHREQAGASSVPPSAARDERGTQPLEIPSPGGRERARRTQRATGSIDARATRPGRPAQGGEPEVVRLRSPGQYAFFERIMRRQMGRAFNSVRLARPGAPQVPHDRPLVVYSNHPSWWDPPFAMLLVSTLGRESYGPIEAAMLERYGFMRRLGLWGVEPATRAGAAAFLRTAEAVLSRPGRMVWITAQGTFVDPRARPVALRPGAARLMARLPDAVALPVAVEYPFWTESKPEALARFGPALEGSGTPAEWQTRLEAALTETMDALAHDAVARDPAPFSDLLRGRSGVGGVYDVWRRARALARGERFDPGHMPEDASGPDRPAMRKPQTPPLADAGPAASEATASKHEESGKPSAPAPEQPGGKTTGPYEFVAQVQEEPEPETLGAAASGSEPPRPKKAEP